MNVGQGHEDSQAQNDRNYAEDGFLGTGSYSLVNAAAAIKHVLLSVGNV